MAAASVGLDVFHIGGETETGVTNQVNRFDTSTKTWSEMAAKPTAVADTTAAVLFGEIYVPGGIGEDGRPTNIVEAYSPANNAWRPIASLPKPLSGSLTVSDNSFLYSLGGWDGSQYLDDVFVYDASSDSWRPLASLPVALASAAGGVISGEIFVLGGENETAVLDTCYVYNIETDTWDSCPAMLHPRANAGAAAILNKLYVLGGDAWEDGETPFGEMYDPNTGIWQVVNTPMLENEDAWTDLGVTHVETKIYALGGKIGNTRSDQNYTYSPMVYQTFIPAAAAGSDAEP
jgi:N-acetylneuraminic acid mutarotase